MANRKATFAKRQRETDLKDRAKQKEDRRSQKRGEVRDVKGPQIAWDEAVHAVTSDELPPLESANQDVIQGSLDLIVMQRQAEMMQKALTVFHTEFNKIATEELPRV